MFVDERKKKRKEKEYENDKVFIKPQVSKE